MCVAEPVPGDVLEELPADREAAAAEHDRGLAPALDLGARGRQQVGDVAGIEGCGDRRDGGRLGHAAGGGQHRGTAQRVADQQQWRLVAFAQEVGRGDQILDVRREVAVGELALARAEAGEIEAQHREATVGEAPADARGRQAVLRAGEAVGEQREAARRTGRAVEPCREQLACGVGKRDLLASGDHGCYLSR